MKRLTHKEAHERLEAMKLYKSEGHTAKEVAEKFGASVGYAKRICKGVSPIIRNQYVCNNFDREANAIRYINDRTPWFEYAGNFTGIDGFVDLRCKACGATITKSFVSVRHGVATCDECKRIKRERAESEKKRLADAKKADRKERARLREANLNHTQITWSICENCGRVFLPKRKGTMYCSVDCANKVNNARTKDKRIKYLKHIVVDKDITLEKLYERDKGVCAICGGMCDWADHVVRSDGTFIARDNYPSIDHIQPISKGGVHAWNNVQLAHFYCNTIKGNGKHTSLCANF